MRKLIIGLVIVFSLCSVATAQNILLNSSFEFWMDSLGIRIPFAWFTSEPQDSGTAVRVMDPHSGIYALKLNGSDTSAYATTLSICFPARNYYFSAWCKSNSIIAGTFIITWLSSTAQPVNDPSIIPIYRSTSWRQYTQMLQCPDSAALVNVNIITLPQISITVDDVTLSDTVLTGIEEERSTLNTIPSMLVVYPNPCNEQVKISVGQNSDILFNRIDLCDVSGNIVKNLNQPRHGKIFLNTKELAPGIYFLRVGTIKGKTTYSIASIKLIVQR